MVSDAELLYAWRNGDVKAGETLFERYFPAVERFISNKVSEDPSDLIQMTFQACVEGRSRIEKSFRSYLFTVAYNVLRRHLKQRYRCREDELASRSIHDIAPGPSTLLLESEQARLLARALRKLPLELQVVLELHYWEDMTSTEIEQMLGINASTVRSYLVRGRRLVLEALRTLEASPALVESTVADLDGWARKLREQIGERRPTSS